MADKEHLEILKRGPEIWNDWRDREFYLAPELSGTDFREIEIAGADLSGGNLSGSNLSGKDLTNADLSDTNLSAANLKGANLASARLVGANCFMAEFAHANFQGADLQAADFRDSDLTEANLSEAYLGGTIFTGANLYRANLSRATLNASTFGDNDLGVVEGLDAVNHGGASVIGINTLYKSSGKIPEVFLRGCGVPEGFITYIPSLFGSAMEFYSCFISYSASDQSIVNKIFHDLQNAGVRCWLAQQNLKTGDDIRSRINDAIQVYDKLLVILSSHSIESSWVQLEIEKALDKELASGESVLFPVRIDDAVLHSTSDWAIRLRQSKHIADFRKWDHNDEYRTALSRLITDLKLSLVSEA